jgi:hypothetical protein
VILDPTDGRIKWNQYKHPRAGGPGAFFEPGACYAACSEGIRWCQWFSVASSSAAHM